MTPVVCTMPECQTTAGCKCGQNRSLVLAIDAIRAQARAEALEEAARLVETGVNWKSGLAFSGDDLAAAIRALSQGNEG